MPFQLCRGRLRLNHPSWLNLHLGTFHKQTTKVAGRRHPGITASVSPRHLDTTACELTGSFPSITDSDNMSDFLCLSTDVGLWDTSTKATWGLLDFCLMVMQFQVHTIMQTQLTALSQAGALGDAEKPQWDMVFVLIVPSLAIGCEWVFGLTAMWVHPHQACLPTWGEAAKKLMLLADKSPNWPYAYAQMNDAVAHMHFSSEGHIGVMTDSIRNMNACSCLDQWQMWKLLQCGGQVVCPEGLNGGLEALLFDFEELPLWNMATTDEPTWDLPLIEVDLRSVGPEVTNTTPLSGHQTSLWYCCGLQPTPPGGLGMAAVDFPHNLTPHLSALHAWKEAAICNLGGSALHQSRRFTHPGGDRLGHPWSDGHLFTGVPHMQSHQKTSLASSKSVTHHPCLSCQSL